MERKVKVAAAIERAKSWLLDSDIQNKDGFLAGSFNAWYDEKRKQYSYAYSEITGYAITMLLYLGRMETKLGAKAVARAGRAADWLIGKAYAEGMGFQCRYYHDEKRFLPHICSFDNGMCLNGLVNLYRVTGDRKYLEISKRIAGWLIGIMQKPDGSFYPKYDCVKKEYLESPNAWSGQSSSYHAKISIGLLNLAEAALDVTYKIAAQKICDWVVARQFKDGRFTTNACYDDTYLHPHCYTVEGLLTAGLNLDSEDYMCAAADGAAWLTLARLGNGGLSNIYHNPEFSTDEHVDSLAQAIRLWIFSGECCDKQIDRLLEFQCESNDPKADGGFYYGIEDGIMKKHINAHATMFALQAMSMWLQNECDGLIFSFYNLV